MDLVIIVAVAENGVIGKDGGIPWHEPADFQHFKETTMGHPVIMGRTTYEGIVDGLGEPLPGRTNIVLSHEDLDVPAEVVNVHGIDDAVAAAADTGAEAAYVAGGATVYEQFLEQDLVDRMVITRIPQSPDGDTFFPDWDRDRWRVVAEETVGGLPVRTYARDD